MTRKLLLLLFLLAFALLATGCARVSRPSGWAGPRLADDTLYVSTAKGKMAALDPKDLSAAPKWVFPSGSKLKCGNSAERRANLQGIYGAPAVEGERLYFGAFDGFIYALSAEDGACLWEFETGDPVVGSLTLTDDKGLFAASTNGKLYLIDTAKCTNACPSDAVRSFDTGSGVWAAPLVTDTTIYLAAMDGHMYALDASKLEPIWKNPISSAGLLLDPVLIGKDTLLAGGIGETLYALDPRTGDQKWSFEADSWFWGRPLVDGATIYIPNLDGHVYALNLSDGTEKWSFEAKAAVRSSPALVGDVLVVIDRDGQIYGLNPESGALAWGGPVTPVLLGKDVLSDPLLLDDQLLIVAQGGGLFHVDPTNGATRFVEAAK